jgi:hypothetical protein
MSFVSRILQGEEHVPLLERSKHRQSVQGFRKSLVRHHPEVFSMGDSGHAEEQERTRSDKPAYFCLPKAILMFSFLHSRSGASSIWVEGEVASEDTLCLQ